MAFICTTNGCNVSFTTKRSLTRHKKNQHGNLWSCQQCNQTFNRSDNFEYHQRTCLFKKVGKRMADKYDEAKKRRIDNVHYLGGALQNTFDDFRINLEDEGQSGDNIMEILKNSVFEFKGKISKELHRKKSIKLYFSLHANFHLSSDPLFLTEPSIVLNTDVEDILESSDLDDLLRKKYEDLQAVIENFELRGSGWVLDKLLRLDLHVCEYNPLRGTSYIPLPKELQHSKKGVINIKNQDEKCFLWSVIAKLYGDPYENNPNRVSHYIGYENRFNLQGLNFPMKLNDIPKFERQNNISISVYGYQNWKDEQKGFVYPLKVSKDVNERHVDLLLISDDDSNHYCFIKDFAKLVGSQYSNHSHKTYFCRFCLHGFSRSFRSKDKSYHRRSDEDMKEKLRKHEETCFSFVAQRTEFPEDPIIKFSNFKKMLPAPFVVYSDFESILKNLSDENKVKEHLACSFSYQIVSNVDGIEFDIKVPYIGYDAVDKFLDSLQDDLNKFIMPLIERDVQMIWNDTEKTKFEQATECHICKEKIDRAKEVIVREHCHFTGKFRGAAHQECNLAYKIDKSTYKLPIVFHNLRGYDSHLIFQRIKRRHGKIDVIPNNCERYISFTVGRLKFLDSMQFLSSLEKLAKQLKDDQFHYLKKFYPDSNQRSLMTKKGIYCYEYMDKMEKFEDQKLPDKEFFYNSLDDTHISDKDYIHAQTVWESMGCETMKDYHNYYLLTDVLLLTDIFENFRNMSLNTFNLDPLHYYSLPGLSWDVMLKFTKIELDLITDPDMYQMIEKGMRGGISNICYRFATSNHPDMESYNPAEELRTLIYQDANALYSWAMSQLLPTRNFQWKSPIDFDVLAISKDSPIGYILEVDLIYTKELHDAHNLYPLAPEHVQVSDEMLSPFQKEYFPPLKGSVKKLIPNLHNKEKYVVHYQNLQLYIQLGMRINKIHRVIQFEQSRWMKPYIDLNIEKRKEAVKNGDKVGKDLFKLFNNAVFGKTMENLRKRINFEIVTSKKIALKRIAKPNFQRARKFREDLVGIHMAKPLLVLNRPIQVGFAILDLSKFLMYDFHYNKWLKEFPRSTLLFTDTDSLAYEVVGQDIYEGMAQMKDEFDFSEYPKDHFLYSVDNMKKVGKFKDECHGQLMLKFIGLRPKLYSYDYNTLCYFTIDGRGEQVLDESCLPTSIRRIVSTNKNTAKGIEMCVAKGLSFDEYERCLSSLKPKEVNIKRIGSDLHKIYTYSTNKIGLSAFDTKRWICDDGISKLAFGHWRTEDNIAISQ